MQIGEVKMSGILPKLIKKVKFERLCLTNDYLCTQIFMI